MRRICRGYRADCRVSRACRLAVCRRRRRVLVPGDARAVLIAFVPFAAVAQAPHAASCAAKSAEGAAVELLEVSGVFARSRAESDDVVAQLRIDNPQVPAEYWSEVARRLADRGPRLTPVN
jgi:hypothetical protein